MEFLRGLLTRPTLITSGVALLLIAAAGTLSPIHQAAAAPQTANGLISVVGGKTATVVPTATPAPTAKHPIIVITNPTAVPTFPPVPTQPPGPTPPPRATPPPQPTPTATPPPLPTPTPTPGPGVLVMNPSGIAFANCTTGQWVAMTLTNQGQKPLTWTAAISASGNSAFGVYLTPSAGTLAPGASITIHLNGFFRVVPNTTNSVTVFTQYTSVGVHHGGPFITQFCN